MRRIGTLLAATSLAALISACQLLPFAPFEPGSGEQSPLPEKSAGVETMVPTSDPIESVPASIEVEPTSPPSEPSPSIEIPPPID